MKRIWGRAELTGAPGAYTITLDGKPHRTLPSIAFRPLAEALQREWQNAPPEISPDDLPLTRLTITAEARIAHHKPGICRQLAAYGQTDLLCQRAPEPPLAELEEQSWQPWLDWSALRHGVALNSFTGIMPGRQPPQTVAIFEAVLAAMTIHELAALGVIVPALGSLILGLALQAGALTPLAACRLSWLDELWQEARWGMDRQALQQRELIQRDVTVSTDYMLLCRP